VGVLDGWSPWHLCVSNVTPVEFSEPGVLLYLLPVVASPQSLRRIGVQQAQNHVSRPQGEKLREFNNSFQYLFVDVARLLVVVERRVPSEQLIDEDADSPVIHRLPIARLVRLLQHLRREVFRGSADGESSEVVQLLGKAEVYQFGEAFRVDHDVFGFEVSEHDVVGVEVRDGVEDPGDVEHGSVIVEPAVSGEPGEELSALYVLEHHVDVLGVLEGLLAGCLQKYRATMLGWLISSSTSFSECRCISWFCSKIYCFRMILSA